jgi:hypothetical protein
MVVLARVSHQNKKENEMRKTITYNIKYNEKGNINEIPVTIKFVSNYVMREYSEIMAEIGNVRKDWDTLTLITAKRELLKNADGDNSEELEKIDSEIKKIEDNVRGYKDNDFFKKRFDLIQVILEDNGIENEMLLSSKFWDRKIEPQEIINFLNAAIAKDTDPGDNESNGQKKKPKEKQITNG